MRSIDKLRKYVTGGAGQGISIICEKNILKNLDAIEREVEDMRDFCERLDDAATKRGDVTLWGVDYMPYPLDADGVPIHVGDVMENIVCSSVHREVTGVGVECFYGWDDGNGRYSQFDANCYRHHHAPTVEDVLREFGAGWYEQMSGPETFDIADYVERYAARLRLAGEDA